MWFGTVTKDDVLADIRDAKNALKDLVNDAECVDRFLDNLSAWLRDNQDILEVLFPGKGGLFKQKESKAKYDEFTKRISKAKGVVTKIIGKLSTIEKIEAIDLPEQIKERVIIDNGIRKKETKSTKAALGIVKQVRNEFKELWDKIDYISYYLIDESRDKTKPKVIEAKLKFLEHMINGFKCLIVREKKDWTKFDETARHLREDMKKAA